MGCECNTKVKIIMAIAGIFSIAAIIVVIVGVVGASEAVKPDFEAEGVKSATMKVTQKEQCSWQIYWKEGVDCRAAVDAFKVTGPATWKDSQYSDRCSATDNAAGFEIVHMDDFNLKMYATVSPSEIDLAAAFQAKDVTTHTFTVETDMWCDWAVYFPEATDCNTAFNGLTVTGPNGFDAAKSVKDNCATLSPDQTVEDGVTYEKYVTITTKGENEMTLPGDYTVKGSSFALKYECTFAFKSKAILGDYVMASTGEPFWVRDVCKDIGEAAKGIFESIGLMMLAIVLFVVSAIFCCVACCCGCGGGK